MRRTAPTRGRHVLTPTEPRMHSTTSRRRSSARRRLAAAGLAVLGVTGLGIASAAQLNLTSAPLGAGSTIVATCQSTGTITVAFPTAWNTTQAPAAYRVSTVTLSNVNASCAGKPYRLQLLNNSSAALGAELTGNLSLTGGVATIAISAANQPLAADLGGVALVIQG